MKPLLLLVAVFALVVTACSGATTTTSTAAPPPSTQAPADPEPETTTPAPTGVVTADYTPRFEDADCEFVVPIDRSPRCGYLVVPEDRANPDGSQVRLHAAIFPAQGDAEPDPVVYLEGGPGGFALEGLQFSFEERFGPFTENRELIIFDQRGVGFSEPSLVCDELRELEIELLDDQLTPEAYNAREAEALADCRSRIAAFGIDVTSYTSADNAADVADLRIALGYDEWNLYGISYGTRLALTTMRDHPDGIRSVILDSTVPIQNEMLLTGPGAAQGAFDAFFADCAADPTCRDAYPDLEDRFYALVDQLNAEPAVVSVQDFMKRDDYAALLTGDQLTGLLFQGLYSEQIIPLLPDMIDDATEGDFALAERIWSAFFTQRDFFSAGMYISVQCSEEYAFTDVGEAAAAAAQYPNVAYIYADPAGEYAECDIWGAGVSDDIETEAVTSPIPTLVLAGEFDPITPPAYGQTVAADLANSQYFEFRGLAHGVSAAGDCPRGISLAFLDDPTKPPAASCIDDLPGPAYVVDGQLDITLVPFTEEFFSVTITGVVPDDWTSQGFGAYVSPGLGDSGIIQQVLPALIASTDELLGEFSDQFGVTEDWDTVDYDDGRSWTISSNTDGSLLYDVALAEDDGLLFIVVLVTIPENRDVLYDEVLLPALAAVDVLE